MRGRSGSLDAILEEAGVTTPAKDLIVILGGVALACFALGLVMGQPVVGLLLALMCPVVGRMMLSMLADRRRRAFGGQLDEILQMMAGSLRAGYSLPQAVATISQEAGDPVAQEFARVTNETRVGRSMMESLDDLARRMRNEDFYWITQAIGINREVGGNLADVLDNVSNTIRQRTQMKRQVAALAADGKLSAIILMLLPFVIALVLFFLSPALHLEAVRRAARLGHDRRRCGHADHRWLLVDQDHQPQVLGTADMQPIALIAIATFTLGVGILFWFAFGGADGDAQADARQPAPPAGAAQDEPRRHRRAAKSGLSTLMRRGLPLPLVKTITRLWTGAGRPENNTPDRIMSTMALLGLLGVGLGFLLSRVVAPPDGHSSSASASPSSASSTRWSGSRASAPTARKRSSGSCPTRSTR